MKGLGILRPASQYPRSWHSSKKEANWSKGAGLCDLSPCSRGRRQEGVSQFPFYLLQYLTYIG